MNLFNFNDSGANFSSDRKYRYALWRIWDTNKPLVMFIGLNPSTANENDTPQGNDNTITKVKKIARNNGYGGVYMLNLFPHITTDPNKLPSISEDMQDEDWHLCNAITTFIQIAPKCKDVVFAWGAFKQAKEKAKIYTDAFPNALCLKITKDGSPWHPLYCRDDTKLIKYQP